MSDADRTLRTWHLTEAGHAAIGASPSVSRLRDEAAASEVCVSGRREVAS